MTEGVATGEPELLRFAALTDTGQHRSQNEDNFLVDKKLNLFLVCDGMGGHAAGEVASAIAVRAFHEEIRSEWERIEAYRLAKVEGSHPNHRDITLLLEAAANRCSSKVNEVARSDESKRGMGTTLVALLVVENEAFIVHVGDSRLYLLRGGAIEQITEDHNVMNELVRRKKLPREKVEQLAQRNAVTRAIGVYEHVEADTLVLELANEDRLLLCSDGLSMYYEDDLGGLGQLLRIPDENEAAEQLVRSANELGGKDNITAIIVTVQNREISEERARKLALKRQILSRTQLFKRLTDREVLRVLQVTEAVQFQDGEVVMQEGRRGDELFIVLSGQVQVRRRDTVIATLTPGEHVGEMALLRTQPRSASVVSDGPSELMVIHRPDFFEILRREHQLAVKLLWQLTGVLAERLAAANQELSAVKEELAEDLTDEIFMEDDEEDRKTLVMLPPVEAPADLDSSSYS